MTENYTELYNRTDGISDDILKRCIEYANKEIIAGSRRPAAVLYFAFECYKRARLLEDKVREVSARIYFDPLPKKMQYDYWQFIDLLDPQAKEICDKEYGHRSPYAEKKTEQWRQQALW